MASLNKAAACGNWFGEHNEIRSPWFPPRDLWSIPTGSFACLRPAVVRLRRQYTHLSSPLHRSLWFGYDRSLLGDLLGGDLRKLRSKMR